jgi:predicted acylesterase/phospholipase RssA
MQARKGTPLLKTEVLIEFLNELFAEAAPNAKMPIQELNRRPDRIQLAITGSDLSRGKGETFEQGNVVETIASSCAIPFAFRTYCDIKTSPYVDGGVCENLPVERLLKDEDNDGAVFAVSIVEENAQPYIPGNVKEYLLQLLSASMNHNVDRAKRLVGLSNVIEARTRLTTFDFEGAISKLGDNNFYNVAHTSTLSRMIHFSQLHQNIQSTEPFSLSGRVSAYKVMRSLFKVFESTLASREWEYVNGAFLVRADSLQNTASGVRLADRISRMFVSCHMPLSTQKDP